MLLSFRQSRDLGIEEIPDDLTPIELLTGYTQCRRFFLATRPRVTPSQNSEQLDTILSAIRIVRDHEPSAITRICVDYSTTATHRITAIGLRPMFPLTRRRSPLHLDDILDSFRCSGFVMPH